MVMMLSTRQGAGVEIDALLCLGSLDLPCVQKIILSQRENTDVFYLLFLRLQKLWCQSLFQADDF